MFKTTKSKLIFVIIFSIICITITTFLVLYKNIDIEDKNSDVEEQVAENKEKDFSGIDLKGKYNQNDIAIEKKKATKEKVEINYCQISGLKDKNIQDKINKEIEQVALNSYKDKVKELNEVVNVNVNVWNFANFANTVSFYVDYYAKIDDDTDNCYQGQFGLNYDLTTGNKITLDKVFTSDAPIENILSNSAYYSLVHTRTEENLSGDFVVNNYGDIEEEILEIINLYKENKLLEFYYTPNNISIIYEDNKVINIKMKDYAEYIAIYNRYLTSEEIYESNNVGFKNLYTLTNKSRDYVYYINYQNEKNYLIEINILNGSEDEFVKTILDQKIKELENEVQRIKTLASQYSNNFYILNYYLYAYTGEDWQTKQNRTSLEMRGNSYEITLHDFEENIEPIIIEYNRSISEEGIAPDYVYYFENSLKIAPQETIEYYNPDTGEKIVI